VQSASSGAESGEVAGSTHGEVGTEDAGSSGVDTEEVEVISGAASRGASDSTSAEDGSDSPLESSDLGVGAVRIQLVSTSTAGGLELQLLL
jgi:hypothetical protein